MESSVRGIRDTFAQYSMLRGLGSLRLMSDERLQAEEQNNYTVFYLIELKIMKNTLYNTCVGIGVYMGN
jgi:hypothetical protein